MAIIIKSKCLLKSKIPSILELAGSCSLSCQKSGASQIKGKKTLKVRFPLKKLIKLLNRQDNIFLFVVTLMGLNFSDICIYTYTKYFF